MDLIAGYSNEQLGLIVLSGATLILAVAFLLHIRKEPSEAHGKRRK